MRLVPILVLALSVAACDKSTSKNGPSPEAPAAPGAKPAADPVTKDKAAEPVAKAADPAAKAAEPAVKAPEPPKPVTQTGVLDLEMQEVEGGYQVITPRVTLKFPAKPTVQRQDAKTPFGDTIPGAVAVVESGNRFSGLIYIPIPKELPYDVPKGLKGARDGMLGMFEGKYEAKDEKVKLGPFTANHVIADGSRAGHAFHVEAWIAYDPAGHTVYGVMSLRTPDDLEGIAELPAAFTLRADAKVAETEPGDVGAVKSLLPSKAGKAGNTKAVAKPTSPKPAPTPTGDDPF
ncbi:MAG: hypothetical protein IPQ07_27860 [Myxococcales bacterium]|nr:hypothetical protein [Myxococcales bacterium]